ncbi:MAG: hypothetical protein BWY47_00185 [Bacteroidetes bacterium ADurb.Bin302]|nr:MAG: hypothetical protein BWY47_00185 [Bacteroidetes bacterium ADurb.Bin302]
MNVKKDSNSNSMTVISLSPLEVMMMKDILHDALEIYDDMSMTTVDDEEEEYVNYIIDFIEELEASL